MLEIRARVAILGLILLLVTLSAGCQSLPFGSTPTPAPPTSTPEPAPLTSSAVAELIAEQLGARGVDASTVRVSIKSENRMGSVRYTSPYDWASSEYNAQAIISAMLISRAMLRVVPPIGGGLQVSIIPQGSAEVGLHVITITDSDLAAWADGSITDQEFVARWTNGIMTKE
jgi:hypothetical protein